MPGGAGQLRLGRPPGGAAMAPGGHFGLGGCSEQPAAHLDEGQAQ